MAWVDYIHLTCAGYCNGALALWSQPAHILGVVRLDPTSLDGAVLWIHRLVLVRWRDAAGDCGGRQTPARQTAPPLPGCLLAYWIELQH